MKAVSNAGPLIALAKLGALHLLREVFDFVLTPTIVFEEVVTHGLERGQADAYAVQLAIARRDVIVVSVDLEDDTLGSAEDSLHAGERAAILLAKRENTDWLLLDDELARIEAKRDGLQVKGTLGVVIEAYRRELLNLDEATLLFDAILAREDIWISESLVTHIRNELLKEAGERNR